MELAWEHDKPQLQSCLEYASAMQASSSMLCRFALWFVGTACDLAGHRCYATLADLLQSKWLCELINYTDWLFIIAVGYALDACQNQWLEMAYVYNFAMLLLWILCPHQAFPLAEQYI